MVKILSNTDFYNEIASGYDDMVSFGKLIEKKSKDLAGFIDDKIKSAADIGCGTGVDSIALSLSGLKVTAFDPSSEMISVAKTNAAIYDSQINFYISSSDEIPKEFNDQFDLVVSLGNTFANIPSNKFAESIQRCYRILKPGGRLLVQILNYANILNNEKRIVNIREGKDNYFIRFYDFYNEYLVFNILTFSKLKPSEQSLISTKLFPHSRADFDRELLKTGFYSIQFFSDLGLSDFNVESKDLIVSAWKK